MNNLTIRSYHRKQVKCNFCFNWFPVLIQVCSLNICQDCFHKAQTTNSFKIQCPLSNHYYRLVLIPTITTNYQQIKNQLLQEIQNQYLIQIDQVMHSWKQIATFIENKQDLTQKQISNLKEFLNQNNHKNIKLNTINDYLKTQYSNNSNDKSSNSLNDHKQIMNQITNDQQTIKIHTPSKQQSKYNKSYVDVKNVLSTSIEIINEYQIQPSIHQYVQYQQQNNNQDDYTFRSDISLPFFKHKFYKTLQTFWTKRTTTLKDEYFNKQQKLKNKIYNNVLIYSKLSPVLHKIMTQKIYEAVTDTITLNNCIQLVSHKISDIEIKCYLESLIWDNVKVLKLVKVGLTNSQFKTILEFLSDKKVQTIVVTGNYLSEQSCEFLLTESNNINSVRNIYLSNNMISQLKVKMQIRYLKQKFMIYL